MTCLCFCLGHQKRLVLCKQGEEISCTGWSSLCGWVKKIVIQVSSFSSCFFFSIYIYWFYFTSGNMWPCLIVLKWNGLYLHYFPCLFVDHDTIMPFLKYTFISNLFCTFISTYQLLKKWQTTCLLIMRRWDYWSQDLKHKLLLYDRVYMHIFIG